MLPVLLAEGLPAIEALLDGMDFGRRLRSIDAREPIGRCGHRPRRQRRQDDTGVRRGCVHAQSQAAPAPILRPPDEAGAQRIAFDVTAERQEMALAPSVGLDRKALVCPLIQVPAPGGVAVFVPSADVRHGEALHESAEIAVIARAQHQVPMVGHQAVGEQLDRHHRQHLGEALFKGRIVTGTVEEISACVRAV